MAKDRELYDAIGGPLYAVHFNGLAYAKFSGPDEALAYWRGLDERGQSYFHIEDGDGKRVTLHERSRGHAYAILEALDRAKEDK